MKPDPDRALAAGESLVLAGPAAEVERFEQTVRSWTAERAAAGGAGPVCRSEERK